MNVPRRFLSLVVSLIQEMAQFISQTLSSSLLRCHVFSKSGGGGADHPPGVQPTTNRGAHGRRFQAEDREENRRAGPGPQGASWSERRAYRR